MKKLIFWTILIALTLWDLGYFLFIVIHSSL